MNYNKTKRYLFLEKLYKDFSRFRKYYIDTDKLTQPHYFLFWKIN